MVQSEEFDSERAWDDSVTRTTKKKGAVALSISLIGNANVGKTSLLNYYANQEKDSKSKVTVGTQVKSVWVNICDKFPAKVHIMDTTG